MVIAAGTKLNLRLLSKFSKQLISQQFQFSQLIFKKMEKINNQNNYPYHQNQQFNNNNNKYNYHHNQNEIYQKSIRIWYEYQYFVSVFLLVFLTPLNYIFVTCTLKLLNSILKKLCNTSNNLM